VIFSSKYSTCTVNETGALQESPIAD